MYKNIKMPMRLQFFAQPGAAGSGSSTNEPETANQEPNNQNQSNQNGTQIDYGKIQQMLDGTLATKEDTALKAYFKQQGLSQQEVEQAITTFKEQKAANQPDIAGMQNQITEAQAQLAASQKAVRVAQVESAATMMAVSLGIEAKTIPYILKMADLSQVIGEDGNINKESLKTALNKVLEDVPALKPQADGKTGFTQVGTGGNPAQHPQQTTTTNQTAVPTKRWNRWN